ncbi:MAG: DUF308 domain-containing protein [Lachnospiraceae bacterium]|nr:DUF308 domain-containing protein [Lachnospiraceae bacterium]
MENILKKIKANVVVSAALCVIAGAVLIIWPGMTVQIACRAIGAVLVIMGVSKLFGYVYSRDGSLFSQINLIVGIIITVIGVWIFTSPEKIIAMVPILVGIIIVMHGINNLQQTVKLCKGQYDKWWIALVLGLVTVGFGIVLIVNPFAAVDTLVRAIGIFLVYDGVSDIWIVSRVAHNAKVLRQEKEAVDVDAEEVE